MIWTNLVDSKWYFIATRSLIAGQYVSERLTFYPHDLFCFQNIFIYLVHCKILLTVKLAVVYYLIAIYGQIFRFFGRIYMQSSYSSDD